MGDKRKATRRTGFGRRVEDQYHRCEDCVYKSEILDDLKEAKLDDRVAVMCFSEFGRRVDENGSAGTDHGSAGLVMVAGTKVKGGVHGEYSSLTDLEDGGLKVKTDFRQVYLSVLEQWLKVDSRPALGAHSFPPVSLFG